MTLESVGAAARLGRSFAKVVVGVGNHGAEYGATRHNVGWWVVDQVGRDHGFSRFEPQRNRLEATGTIDGQFVCLVKPLTYMNRSGLAVASLGFAENFRVANDLLVVSDDLYLDVGRIRFRGGGGAGGHKGLRSIIEALDTDRFARLRVGVGAPPPGVARSTWVLEEMSAADEEAVLGLLPTLGEAVVAWARDGIESAMNRYNR